MAKIYELDFRKGSLIDTVGHIQATLVQGSSKGFQKKEKGLSMKGDGAVTTIDTNFGGDLTGTGDMSIVMWHKKSGATSKYLVAQSLA